MMSIQEFADAHQKFPIRSELILRYSDSYAEQAAFVTNTKKGMTAFFPIERWAGYQTAVLIIVESSPQAGHCYKYLINVCCKPKNFVKVL